MGKPHKWYDVHAEPVGSHQLIVITEAEDFGESDEEKRMMGEISLSPFMQSTYEHILDQIRAFNKTIRGAQERQAR